LLSNLSTTKHISSNYHRQTMHQVGLIIFLNSPTIVSLGATRNGVGYMACKWIRISLESWMVSCYKNEIVRAGVSNCMHQCLNFLVLNVHISAYLGSRGRPFFRNFKVFLLCLPIVDQSEFVYTNLY
jgi:hypothetical protein